CGAQWSGAASRRPSPAHRRPRRGAGGKMNVGIDLGTTYSLIGRLESDGTPTLLPDHTDPTLVTTPSVVYIGKDTAIVGQLEEPVAAALHYGISQGAQDQVMLVYDLGGGTFDATVLSLDAKGVYVLAKEGLTNLGGKEFDEKLGAMILERFERAGLTPNL